MTPDAGELMALAELRFFRDLVDVERMKVFKAFGVLPQEHDEFLTHGVQRQLFKQLCLFPSFASRPDREAVARIIEPAAWRDQGYSFAEWRIQKSLEKADEILSSLLSVQVDGEQKITADNERLLSCPFCGPGNSQVDTWHDDVSKRWRVGCGRCGSSSGASVHREGSKEAAIKSWNTRNGSPPVAETKPSPSSTSATATETALRAAKRLCDNINEFGHVTDAEIFDATETAIQKALETINVA